MSDPILAALLVDNLKTVLDHQLAKFKMGITGWMWGYRLHPIKKTHEFHNGVDLGIVVGTELHCPWKGKLKAKWEDNVNGHAIRVEITDGPENVKEVACAHLSQPTDKNVGDVIEANEVMALSGNTGASTGPHVHYVMRGADGKSIDPLPFLLASVGYVELPEHEVG